MTWRSTGIVALAFGAVCFTAGRVLSQDDARRERSAEETLREIEKKAALTDEHRRMARRAGTWDADGSIWLDPSKEPVKTKGTSKFSTVLGGRYLLQEYAADLMGRAFEGRAIFGFDKQANEHFTIWIDNMRSGFEVSREIGSDKGVLIYMSDRHEEQGVAYRLKEVVTTPDEDHMRFERFAVVGEQAIKQVEILYTRRK